MPQHVSVNPLGHHQKVTYKGIMFLRRSLAFIKWLHYLILILILFQAKACHVHGTIALRIGNFSIAAV
jgi:hypothetical protein